MIAWVLALLGVVGLVALAVDAGRRPILLRIALRNAARRPRQAATVVAGLMIGTAIIASALVASDSAGYAIRGYVHQSLGDIDASVAIPGYPFFPAFVADDLSGLEGAGTSMHVIWQGTSSSADGYEPNVSLVGFDAETDAAFGTYSLRGGGSWDGRGLQANEVAVTDVLADALNLQPGSMAELRVLPPVDPAIPHVDPLQGSARLDLGLPVTGPSTHDVDVAPGTIRLVGGLGGPPGSTFTLVLQDPTGMTFSATGNPALFDIPSPDLSGLPTGLWRMSVTADSLLPSTYEGAVVRLEAVYDLARLQERSAPDLPFDLPEPEPSIHTVRVAYVTDGGRGDVFDLRNAVFLNLQDLQGMLGRTGQLNVVKFTYRAPGASADIQEALARLQDARPEIPSIQALAFRPLKEEYLAAADAKGQTLTNLLLFAGSLSVITGALLILNIFTMLAQERRTDNGMARAVGLRRSGLVRLLVYEGATYALAAALLGALLGLGLAFAMIQILNSIVAGLASDLSFPPITYRPSLEAVVAAMAAGWLLTVLTTLVAAARQARLNVVRAIRRIPEPDQGATSKWTPPTGGLLLLAGATALALGWLPAPWTTGIQDVRFSLRVLGALAAAAGVGLLLRGRVRRDRLIPFVAAGLALYYIGTYFVIGRYDNPTETNIVGPVRGVLLTLCVVVLVVHERRIVGVLGRALSWSKRLRPVALPAVSYPLHQRFRTGMSLAMFSVVLLSIAFFSIFGALFQVDPARQTGGYDVEAVTTLAVSDLGPYDAGLLPEGAVEEQVHLAAYRSEDRSLITVNGAQTGTFQDYFHLVYGYDEDFARTQRFALTDRLPQYANDQAVYDDVLARDDRVVVSYIYSTNEAGQALSHHVGENLTIHLGQATRNYTIAAIQEQYHYPGIFLPKPVVQGLFPQTTNVYLFKAGAATDPEELASLLESNYRDAGLDAKASLPEVLREQESFRQVLGAMKLFLGLSLFVGVLSLGILTSRSVLERRQEIGMLRALGYTPKQVRRMFFVEVTFIVVLGGLVGLACALVVTFGLWFAIIRDLGYPYVVPWWEILVTLALSYVVAMAAATLPIGKSGRVAPAEALRYVE